MKKLIMVATVVLSIMLVQSCKKDPSIVKVFVRSASNELVAGAKVIIIGDINSNPATLEYVDTVVTNGSGFALFNVEDYYSEAGKDNSVAYFDVIAKAELTIGTGYVRSRVNTTAVETVYIQ